MRIHSLPARAPQRKKRRVLEYESQYLENLPSAQMYERSYMHRDTVSCLAIASHHEFIITGSVDGHVKFWKKQSKGIEFAKDYKVRAGAMLFTHVC